MTKQTLLERYERALAEYKAAKAAIRAEHTDANYDRFRSASKARVRAYRTWMDRMCEPRG